MTASTPPPQKAQLPDDSTALFLNTLLGRKPADAHLLVWRMPDKKSRSFSDIGAAHSYIASIRDGEYDVYMGVGLSDHPVASAGLRYPVNQVQGIYAFWADIDIRDEVHKKKNLPPNLYEAQNLVNETGLTPTMVVFTGHGLQAWWVLEEPWMFGDDGRSDAIALVTQWLFALKTRAHLRGWEVDSTQDLARVLRVVGSMNRKSEPVEVTIMDYNANAIYTLDDIRRAIAKSPVDVTQTAGISGNLPPSSDRVRFVANGLVIDSQAEPPFDKWNALMAENTSAQRTFDHKRELSSASEYDFALAVMAIQASMCEEPWTDQEITNLLIAHRRKNKLELKLRANYYAMTCLKARERVTARWANEDLAAAYDEYIANPSSVSSNSSGDSGAHATANSIPTPITTATVPKLRALPDTSRPTPTPKSGPTPKPTTPRAQGQENTAWNSYLAAIGSFGQSDEDSALAAMNSVTGGGGLPEDVFVTEMDALGDDTQNDDAAIERAAAINRLGNGATAERVLRGLDSIFRLFSVLRVVKFAATPPVYNLIIRMNDTRQQIAVNLGGIEGLTSFRQFRNRVAENAGVLIEPQKTDEWDNVVRWMLAIAEVESIGDEATEQGQIRAWLDTYLTRFSIERDWAQGGEPPAEGAFIYADRVHITSKHLLWWLKNNEGEKMSAKILGQMLRSVGCETVTVPFKRPDGKRTSCAAWRLPADMVADFLAPVMVSDG